VPDHWYAGGAAGALGGAEVASAGPDAARAAMSPRRTGESAASRVSTPAVSPEGEPITMPFGDLTVSEGKLVKWLKAVGDAVEAGDVVAEIETDKAVVEIEALVAGTIAAIEQPVGATVPMGGRIGVIAPSRSEPAKAEQRGGRRA